MLQQQHAAQHQQPRLPQQQQQQQQQQRAQQPQQQVVSKKKTKKEMQEADAAGAAQVGGAVWGLTMAWQGGGVGRFACRPCLMPCGTAETMHPPEAVQGGLSVSGVLT
jgi:hypothetical protein